MLLTQRTSHRGFTLLELMIVIVIIGLLISIGTFAFQSSQRKARDSRRKADLSQISKALEMFNNDHYTETNKYPTASANGEINGCGSSYTDTCAWGTVFGNIATVPNVIYMIRLPKDPTAAWHYVYEKVNNGYRLYARLENLEDQSFQETGPVEYAASCGTDIPCNYVLTSTNTANP